MPLYLNNATITVIREGRRVKVKPSKAGDPRPFDFTDVEVASAEQAGVVMSPFKKVRTAATIESAIPVAEPAPAPVAEKPAAKARAKAKNVETDGADLDDDAL